MRNVTLKTLIALAHEVEDYRISGGPGWITSARYDVDAKPAAPVDAGQARLMLQALLGERFGLRVHHETTPVPGYRLVVEKSGKLRNSDGEREGFEVVSPGEIRGPATMAMLVYALKAVLGSPVADATGLTGKYEIELKWKSDSSAAAASAVPGVTTASEPELTIFTAIRQQLGLGLKAGKVPVDMIVVDGAMRKPEEN